MRINQLHIFNPRYFCLTSLWFVFALLVSMNSMAATYYVSPSGNDNHSGSISAPWLHIQHAADNLIPGDTVFVRAGNYSEAVTINVSGSSSGGYIQFRAFPGETAVVDGSSLVVPLSNSGLFQIKDHHHIIIDGFELKNYSSNVQSRIPVGIFVVGTAHHIQLRNNYIHHIETSAVDNGSAHGIAVYGTQSPQSIYGLVIDGNELDQLSLGVGEALALNGNVKSFKVSNNRIHDNNNTGLALLGFKMIGPADDTYNQVRYGVVSGNNIYHTDSSSNVVYSGEKKAAAIYAEGATRITIENNHVYQSNIGIEIASKNTGKSTSQITVRNNFIYQNHVVGIILGGEIANQGITENCALVNNTFFHNDSDQTGKGELSFRYDTRNNTVQNNIIYANIQSLLISNAYSQNSNNLLDYNVYFASSGEADSIWQWKIANHRGFSNYQTATGNDAHSQFIDPIFFSLSQPDLHILSNSPAIDQGNNIALSGVLDIDLEVRVQNSLTDVGADEHSPLPPPSFTLHSNQWTQISLPCDPGAFNSVNDIFSDDITGTYGDDWVVYGYNPVSNSYFDPTLAGSLKQGRGYWVIQTMGVPVVLDMPDSCTVTPVSISNQCQTANGCYEVPLATSNQFIKWSMLGFPFRAKQKWNDFRIVSTQSSCSSSSGCSLNEAKTADVFHNQAWRYNASTKQYGIIEGANEVRPWDAAWVRILSQAQNTHLRILMPSDVEHTISDDGDGDGIKDRIDNCPDIPNNNQLNSDTDSFGDACDEDDDNDSLSDEDEIAAGTDPKNADTDGDTVPDNRDDLPLDGTKAATLINAHRLLTQASFGARLSILAQLEHIGVDAWVEAELAKSSAYDSISDNHLTHFERTIQAATTAQPSSWWYETPVFNQAHANADVARYQMATWWENSLGIHPTNTAQGNDQLRQRVAYALSQLLVVSNAEPLLNKRAESLAVYYDLLAKHAFGNYRDLLGEIARSPAMGIYLSHQGNQKANANRGTRPDENFARELMQLFSIGLYELNLDGSENRDNNPNTYPDLGSSELLIPTYTQEDIEELAKVMTGWDLVDNGHYGDRYDRGGDYTQPMEFTAAEHEDELEEGGDGHVTLLNHTFALDAGTDHSGMDSALDILFNHTNLAPYISRHLIMRLVTSNPSSTYTARVARIFNDNGGGVRGDLAAVVKAVLLDEEARGDTYKTMANYGKAKEPMLAWTQLLRAFNVTPLDGWKGRDGTTSVSGLYWHPAPERQLGHAPMRSPSVFNFYSPDYVPSNLNFTDNNLVSPELQVQTDQRLIAYNSATYRQLNDYEKNRIEIDVGMTLSEFGSAHALIFGRSETFNIIDFTPQLHLFETLLDGDTNGDFANMKQVDSAGYLFKRAEAIEGLINHLDRLLLGNTMTTEFHTAMQLYLMNSESLWGSGNSNNFPRHARWIVRDAVRFIITSSSYMIQK